MYIKCECGNDCDGNVCTNCGLVLNESDIVCQKHSSRRSKEDNIGKYIFTDQLSPDIEYYHLYPKNAKQEDLNRALKIQKHKNEKDAGYYYFRSMKHVERICASLKLPDNILKESLHVVKSIIENKKTFFNFRIKGDYRELAAVRVACQIHDYWIDVKEFVIIARDYDYKPINLRNNPIKRAIDKEMMNIKRILKIYLPYPEHPNFINVACRYFGIQQTEITKIHDIYTKIKPCLNQAYKLEGYILALIYLNLNHDYKITIAKIEEGFCVARDTVRRRVSELMKIINSELDG